MGEASVSARPAYAASSGPEIGIKDRYTSPAFLALEAERLWPRVWQLVCHTAQIPSAGDFFEYTIVDQSVLLVRTADKGIKAFHNACQHRGMQLKVGAGRATELRCPSHAWTWNLDGTLKAVTDAFDFDEAAVAPECLSLPEVRVDTWGGFVFVNLDGQAPPLLEFLAPVPDRLKQVALGDMALTRVRSARFDANWKLGYEAFVESYHLVGTHPQSLTYFDETSLIFEQHGDHGMHRGKEGGMGSPSLRLDEDSHADKREMMVTMLSDLGAADLFNEEEAAQMDALLDMVATLPPEVSVGSFFAGVRRQAATAQGIDLTDVSDWDLMSGEVWNLFPNFTIPSNALNALVIRFRPNGWDPNTSIMDVWYLEHQGPDGPGTAPVVETYDHWTDCKTWGRVLEQDFTNLAQWQRGVRSAGFRGPIWGRQDGNNGNFHRALTNYVSG
jgi:phenylpropionate dioxygenase-like ring-hydroxylating dioxygenase large terminal subunit